MQVVTGTQKPAASRITGQKARYVGRGASLAAARAGGQIMG
jgi:hypothetical protein